MSAVLRLVIFDCDGVLFRSAAANLAFYNEVLRRVGEPSLSPQGEHDCQALAANELFQRHYGERPELFARLRAEAGLVDYGPFYALMVPSPGLRPVLSRLRGKYKTAMATNRGKTAQEVLVRFGIADLFDRVVGAHDVARPKPFPDMLLRCANDLAIEPAHAIYIGDQASDAASARRAGMRFVAMGPMLRGIEAHTVENLDELESLLGDLDGDGATCASDQLVQSVDEFS